MQCFPDWDFLNCSWCDAVNELRPHDGRDGQRERLTRNAVYIGERSFPELLLTAGFIKLDNLNEVWIIKISDGRVVKSEMPIFTNADAGQINLVFAEQARVSLAFGV